MMTLRWITVIILILAVSIGYLASLNATAIEIVLPFLGQFTLTSGLLMIFAFAIGIFFALLFFALRDWKEFFRREAEKKKKKLARIAREKLLRSRGYIHLDMIDAAKSSLNDSLDKNPELADSHELIGDLLFREGDYYGAVSRHNQALSLEPGNDTVRWKLAIDYLKAGDNAMADKVLKEGLAENEKNTYLMVKYRDLLMELKDWDGAINIHNRLARIKEYKSIEDHRHVLAGIWYEKGKSMLEGNRVEEAVRAFEESSKLDQKLSTAYIKWGNAYIAQKKDKAALKIWALGYRRTSDKAVLSRLEEYYLKNDDPSRIINLYLRHIEEKPDDALLRLQFAGLLFKLEMLQEAQNQIEEIHKLHADDNPQVTYLAYRLKEKMEDIEGALKELSALAGKCLLGKDELICANCQKKWPEPLDRCPECGRWGSLRKTV